MSDKRSRSVIRAIDTKLDAVYGPRMQPGEADPLAVLAGTILSQNTNDRNSTHAYRRMRKAFPTWQAVMNAPSADLEDALRPGGLAKIKAAYIQKALRSISETGRLSLNGLKDLDTEEALKCLLALEGVGYKTALCVLLFALGRDVFPIDTHIERILKRLGVIPPGMSVTRAHQIMPSLIPKGRAYALHVNLIAHGKAVCAARNPKCIECAIRRHCPYGKRQRDG